MMASLDVEEKRQKRRTAAAIAERLVNKDMPVEFLAAVAKKRGKEEEGWQAAIETELSISEV